MARILRAPQDEYDYHIDRSIIMMTVKKTGSSAFTLVEIMVSMSILFTILAILMTSFLHLHRASAMTSLYSELHSDVRYSVDLITKDVMCASSVSAYPATNDITLTCEMPAGPALVRYYLQSRKLYRSVDGANEQVVGNNIQSAAFSLFTRGGASTVQPAQAVFVDSYIYVASGTGKNRAEDMLQARTLMRNKSD